jgi:dihydroorotate dehydrogenase (fumarate)
MDLSTKYLGMKLKNPIVPSASALSRNLDGIRKLEDAGAAAVVMYSLFEEQIDFEGQELDHYLTYGTDSFAEALSYFPDMENYNVGPDEYLDLIRKTKKAVRIPVIGSLNGVSSGGWTRYAKLIQEAGADALELNVYYIPTNPEMKGEEVEQIYIDVLKSVKKSVRIPVAIKIGAFFSSTANMCRRLVEAGADGIVMFNRFYQPDIDLKTLEVVPSLSFSRSAALRLPLRWVAILYGKIKADFAVTTGVHTHEDVIKAMMVGANVAQMAAELLQNGPKRIGEILKSVQEWMEQNEYDSVSQMRGSMSQQNVAEPAAFERANYMKVLQSFRPDPAVKKV